MKNVILILTTILAVCYSDERDAGTEIKQIINGTTMEELIENTTLEGSWKINQLIGDEIGGLIENPFLNDYKNEFQLTKADDEYAYGDNVQFNPDNTFISYYSAPCGNDCFTKTYGTYRFTDERRVQFLLERIVVTGDCPNSDTALQKDLGLFFIHQDSACIKLIPSNGDLALDAQKVKYSHLIDAFDHETREVYNFICLPNVRLESRDVPNIVKEYFLKQKDFEPENLEVLYSKTIRSNKVVILLENKQTKQNHFLVYFPYSKTAGLYDPVAFAKFLNRKMTDIG